MTRRWDGHPIYGDGKLLHGRPEGLRTGYLKCRAHHPRFTGKSAQAATPSVRKDRGAV